MFASLNPDTFRINTHFQVIELYVCLQVKGEQPINIYEYLVADNTGCIILNTRSELEIGSIYEMQNGHTAIVQSHLRLYSNQLESSTLPLLPNTQYNRSFVQLERKI